MQKENFNKAYNNRARNESDQIQERLRAFNNKATIQPKMRFRARTDLERIFDILNKNSLGNLNKNMIKIYTLNIIYLNFYGR